MVTSLLALPCKMRALLAQATVRALSREELFDGLLGPGGERSASPLGQYSVTIGSLSKIQGGEDTMWRSVKKTWSKGAFRNITTEGVAC
jgi:hypothetical protein